MRKTGNYQQTRPRRSKKVSEAYLERAAFAYLGRFSSTRANLERVLANKVRKRHGDLSPPSGEEDEWITRVASKCERLGLVDDATYARDKVRSMHRAGRSVRRIKGYLFSKGVTADLIDDALRELGQTTGGRNPDREAAVRYARKRRLGPFRSLRLSQPRDNDPNKTRERELGALARAGFSFDVARRVLDCQTIEEAEALINDQ